MVISERPLTDIESVVTLEDVVEGLLAVFGVARDVLEAVDRHLAVFSSIARIAPGRCFSLQLGGWMTRTSPPRLSSSKTGSLPLAPPSALALAVTAEVGLV